MVHNSVFTSARLSYHAPTREDAQEIFSSYAADSDVTRYTTWRPHVSIQETEQFLQTCIQQWEENQAYNLLLRHLQTRKVIGMIRYMRNKRTMQVGYVISCQYWNQGYATEAVRRILTYAFTLPDVDTVTSFCDIENRASARVLEKAGLRFLKILPEHIIHPVLSDQPRDVRFYEITTQEWTIRSPNPS